MRLLPTAGKMDESHMSDGPDNGVAPLADAAMPRPDVSFIMPAYNVAQYVEAAIASAVSQSDVDIEVIVVDDASNDDTARIVAALSEADARVLLLRQVTNLGASAARNVALSRARGRWLAFVDADDVVVSCRSRRLIDLAEGSGADVVADNFERFNIQGTLSSTMIPRTAHPYHFFVDAASYMHRNAMFKKHANLGYIKPMIRSAFIAAHSIRQQEEIHIGEDYHFYLSCLLAGARFIITSETFYKYRVRDGSLSWRLSTADIQRLMDAHAALGIRPGSGHARELQEAARAYAQALETAYRATSAIGHAQSGRWWQAVRSASPRSWTLLSRLAAQAISKRFGSFS